MTPRLPVTESVVAAGGGGWCYHPPEERQRVYGGAREPVPGRYLCGACGEVLFAVPEGVRPAV